jgi:serine/threonine protein kinase
MVQEDESRGEELPPLPDPAGMTDSPPAGNGAQGHAGGGFDAAVKADDVDLPDNALPDDDSHAMDIGEDVEVVIPDEEPAIARPVDPFIGRTFGGYELVEPIGRGGMGMVYRGYQVSLQRSVAVKLLNKALVDNDEFIKRFQREARSMATIHHQNIVSVIDFGESDGIWYMVAEFVEGTNIARMIRDKLMIPPDELVPLVVHCLSGLAYVSKSKVIHRDIKPDNILIDKDGVAKIADFGLAKDLSKEETDLTAAGSAMGTPAYMSPEQCMGHPLDGRSDLYSLGVTVYYALTGEKPFTGRSSFDIMTKQREYNPPMVHEINPRVPKEISKLVARMMEKLPSNRYPDSSECREEWLQVGQELGYLGSVTRSGEYLFPSEAAKQASVSYPDEESRHQAGLGDLAPAAVAPPAPPPPSNLGDLPGVNDYEPPALPSNELGAGGGEAGTDRRRISTAHRRSEKPKEGGTGRRTGTDRRGGQAEGSITCVRCGALNRASRKRCDKCGHAFVAETAPDAGDQSEADKLFQQGRFRESATMFAKLADRERDRRQRSILRTKEREARTRMEEQRLEDVQTMVAQFERQGKLKEAEKILLKARVEGATTASVLEQIDTEIERLRRKQSRGKHLKLLLGFAVILVVLAIAGWVFRDRIIEAIPALQGQGSAIGREAGPGEAAP